MKPYRYNWKNNDRRKALFGKICWPCSACGARNWEEAGNMCSGGEACSADYQRIQDYDREQAAASLNTVPTR